MTNGAIRPRDRNALQSFLVGSWLNRKYTRLSSSILLGAAISTIFIALIWPVLTVQSGDKGEPMGVVVLLVLNALFFPAAREGFVRVTMPVREGLSGITVLGLLALIALVLRLFSVVLIWLFAIPLGVLSSLWLGIAEASGHGWRRIS